MGKLFVHHGLERTVVATSMLIPEALDDVVPVLKPQDFHDVRNELVWRAIVACHESGVGVDTAAVVSALEASGDLGQAGGEIYVYGLREFASPSHIERRARHLALMAQARRMLDTFRSIEAMAHEAGADVSGWLDRAEAEVLACVENRADAETCAPIGEVVKQVFEDMEAAARGERRDAGLSTGLRDLDHAMRGLRPGELYVVAGRPGMGKSAFVGNIAAHVVAHHGLPVFVASLEMPKRQNAERLLAAEARVAATAIRNLELTRDDMGAMMVVAQRMQGWRLFVDDRAGMTATELRAKARRLKKRHGGLGLVVVDYLQLMRLGRRTDSREQEVAELSRALKELAKELEVPVIALSQLNRKCDDRPNHRPTMGDLRESGAIEQDADAILMLYRDEVYDPETTDAGIAEIIITKQRQGALRTVKTTWLEERMQFVDLARAELPAGYREVEHA